MQIFLMDTDQHINCYVRTYPEPYYITGRISEKWDLQKDRLILNKRLRRSSFEDLPPGLQGMGLCIV